MSTHKWSFFRAGGFNQVSIETGSDLLALKELDQKLWLALSCPVKNIEFDAKTLELVDTDHDGHIRASEIIEAILYNYLEDKRIKNPNHIMSDYMPIAPPIVPDPIEEYVPPVYIDPTPEPTPPPPLPVVPVNFPITKSYFRLVPPVIPAPIVVFVPPAPPPPVIVAPVDPSIKKTFIKLAPAINPAKIVSSKKPI